MKFSEYIVKLVTDLTDNYKNYFKASYRAALLLTFLCFIAMGILLRYSDFDNYEKDKQQSLFNYLVYNHSVGDVYSLVDISKLVFYACIALFSVGMNGYKAKYAVATEGNKPKFGLTLGLDETLIIVVTLLPTIAIDYGLTWLASYISKNSLQPITGWIYGILYIMSFYIPMAIFSVVGYRISHHKLPQLSVKKVLCWLVSLWLFYNLFHDVCIFIRAHILKLILLVTDQSKLFIYDSVAFIPIVACFFLGGYSLLSSSLAILSESEAADVIAV